MKKFFPIFALIAACTFSLFAQQTEDQSCPNVIIVGPAGIVELNQEGIFVARVAVKDEATTFEYVWSITGAEITAGQGTNSITFKRHAKYSSVTATVEIKGLPDGCPNNFSEFLPDGCPHVESRQVDEFSLSAQRIDKARLDYFITQLQNDPTAQGYIIEKFPPQTSKLVIDRKIKLIRDYLSKIRRQDISRFVLVIAENRENLTQFWLVPPGATPPTP